jgi:adenosylhomocysteine nucleosidase
MSMRIGVVVGLKAEARLVRRLGWTVAIGGGTATGALSAADALTGQGCTSLISCGLAGALDPALRPGALIVPSAVLAGDARHATDPALSRILGGMSADTLHGADAIVTDAAAKRALWQQTGAAAVDLESGAVARVAAERGIPFAVLRAICDPAHRTLPPAVQASLDEGGGIALWRVFAALAANPAQLPLLIALAADAAAARRSLLARVRQIARAAV